MSASGGSGRAVHVLAGVVQSPETAELGIVRDVEGAVETDLTRLGERDLGQFGELADGFEDVAVGGHRHGVVAGSALGDNDPTSVLVYELAGARVVNLRAELHGDLVREEIAR